MPNYTQFKIVSDIGDSRIINETENNLKSFLDWSFLGVGAWLNSAVDAYGEDTSKLKVVSDPHYTLGRVWRGRRKDWVYEEDVEYTSQPTSITGVEVDGTTYGTGDATYSHIIDYPLGRVVFDTAVPITSTVKVDHSYRYVQVYKSSTSSWWREFNTNSLRSDNPQFDLSVSGEYEILSQNQIQLPAIVIEASTRQSHSPVELGNGALETAQTVLLHVFGENSWSRSQITDILSVQNDKRFFFFDSDEIVASGVFPLDYRGMKTDGGLMYPNLVESPYRWKKVAIRNVEVAEVETVSNNLYSSVVTYEMHITQGAATL